MSHNGRVVDGPSTRPTPEPLRVVVIGGGFSGAMSAVNIARLSEHPIHITVVDQQRPVGRGVAYRLRRPEYLLNVAARNMSAFPNEPEHFLQWLRTRSECEETSDVELRERFVPRQIYGDYLRSIVQQQLQSPGELSPVTAEFVVGEAVDVEPGPGACRVLLADRSAIDADRVVLATGNQPLRYPAPTRSPVTRRGSKTLGCLGNSRYRQSTSRSSSWAPG